MLSVDFGLRLYGWKLKKDMIGHDHIELDPWARLRLKIRRMDAPCRRGHAALVFEKPELLQASESPEFSCIWTICRRMCGHAADPGSVVLSWAFRGFGLVVIRFRFSPASVAGVYCPAHRACEYRHGDYSPLATKFCVP